MQNYQLITDQILTDCAQNAKRPTLLLHSCCAPCSSYVLEYLRQSFDITVFFYNPNISPKEEYAGRAAEQQRLILALNADKCGSATDVTYLEGAYDYIKFQNLSQGLENVPEGGGRCCKCFALRLNAAAEKAKELGYDYFCTTLSISPLKNAETLNELGAKYEEIYSVKYLYSDFKKKGGYLRSVELSKEYNLYRQNYCGCVYSKVAAQKRLADNTF